MNFNIYFNLGLAQSQLDFVDVNLQKDNELFINSTLITKSNTIIAKKMDKRLKSFMSTLIYYIGNNRSKDYIRLMSGLSEPTETKFGYAEDGNNGKAFKKKLALIFINHIRNHMVTVLNGSLNLSDLQLVIPNISRDRISDFITKICKDILIEYTQQQCSIHRIPMKKVWQDDLYDEVNSLWKRQKVLLPVCPINGRPIILVPKNIVGSKYTQGYSPSTFIRYTVSHFVVLDKTIIKEIKPSGKNNKLLKKDVYNHLGGLNKVTSSILIKRYEDALLAYSSYIYHQTEPLNNDELIQITA